MHAMVLEKVRASLVDCTMRVPRPAMEQVLVRITACGICRTDLHVVDGELPNPKLPLVPGHEIIGVVAAVGPNVTTLREGQLVGVPWLGYTCGKCRYCLRGNENLCENARFTGYTIDGGFAEYTVANEKYCFPLNAKFSEPGSAPLMCAGLIGYRSYSMIDKGAVNLGFYGFGAAAHILIQLAVAHGKHVFAFTREGDRAAQEFAIKLGSVWAGDSNTSPPEKLDAAIIFAPVGALVPKALRDLDKGGIVVCGGIHMSDIPSFPYDILWGERVVRSVANLTRKDGDEFLKIAAELGIKTETRLFPLREANEAIGLLKKGSIQGAAVLIP